MLLLIASMLVSDGRVTPVDGPAFPLKMLKGLASVAVNIVPLWTNGVYKVNFIYQSPLTVAELTRRYRLEVKESAPMPSGADSYSNVRFFGSASQVVWITRNDGVPRKTTKLWITEFASEDSATPSRWYRKAIARKPPIDLIAVPFESTVVAQSASLRSLKGLVMQMPDNRQDAAEFGAHLKASFSVVKKEAAKWFLDNGYRDMGHDAWFKPNVPIFEMTIGPDIINRKVVGSHVQMYFTRKQNDRPVLFGPHA